MTSAQHRALLASSGALGKAEFGDRACQKTHKGSSNVVEAVASASRYKRYKIGGK
jgi:hypothetical protein